MLGLPKSTECNKRIPKQKFYDNLSVSPALKRVFVEQIKSIYWRNKISSSTVNLRQGEIVTEIEVFELKLTQPTIDESALRQIDKEIPYHIVFVLEYEETYQIWTAYKEASSGNNAFKVDVYYQTDWMPGETTIIELEGLDTDSVYGNIVRKIAGKSLAYAPDKSLKDAVEKDINRRVISKRIEKLKSKLRNEKQLNRQIQIKDQIRKLSKELEVSQSGKDEDGIS